MSDPPKVDFRNKKSDEDRSNSNSAPQSSLNRSTSRNAENDNNRTSGSKRPSRKTRSSRKSDANIESITLQESAPRTQPVTLKASFLRRKIKEYEGKKIRLACYQQFRPKIDLFATLRARLEVFHFSFALL